MMVSKKARIVKKWFYVFGAMMIASIVMIGISFYEKYLADRGMNDLTPKSQFYISVSETSNFESEVSFLNVETTTNQGITYASIDDIIQSEGQYIDHNYPYMAYSFYLKNDGSQTININYFLRIINVTNAMHEKIRFLIIEDNVIQGVYQKADQGEESNQIPDGQQLPIKIEFLSEYMVMRGTLIDFEPQEVKSFRIIIWLEEQDPDMEHDIQNGRIDAQMVFSIEIERDLNNAQTQLVSSDSEMFYKSSMICEVQLKILYEEEES
jgi:hypothetical protein